MKKHKLEWEWIAGNDPRLTEKIRELSDIFTHAYTQQELEFARACPDEVQDEYFLKPLAPLVKTGDWIAIEREIQTIFQRYFATTDFAAYSADDDRHLFVIAKDKTGKQIGAIQFLVTAQDPIGTVKAAMFGVLPGAGSGLEILLMSAIFRLLPETKRLYLHTRKTAVQAIERYRSWGFTPFDGTLEKWLDLEYLAGNSTVLQETAETISLVQS